MAADYGQRHGVKSPYDLLMDCGKVTDTRPGSVHALMVSTHASTERTEDYVPVDPEKWRKEDYVRAGQEGHLGPYDARPPRQEQWWPVDQARSTPHQDKTRRIGKSRRDGSR